MTGCSAVAGSVIEMCVVSSKVRYCKVRKRTPFPWRGSHQKINFVHHHQTIHTVNVQSINQSINQSHLLLL